MWRVQVWKGQDVIEGFVLDSEEEAIAKAEEMRNTYSSPDYNVKTEEIPFSKKKWKRMGDVIKAVMEALSMSSH